MYGSFRTTSLCLDWASITSNGRRNGSISLRNMKKYIMDWMTYVGKKYVIYIVWKAPSPRPLPTPACQIFSSVYVNWVLYFVPIFFWTYCTFSAETPSFYLFINVPGLFIYSVQWGLRAAAVQVLIWRRQFISPCK